jgi:energy-coupling factor transporter ATP-binding protein EcfA2
MITKIELTNFKSHAHTVIEPGRVTALVGPNGAGKSSLLQAIDILRQVGTDSLEKVYEDQRHPSTFARRQTYEVAISLQGGNDKAGWEAQLKWEQQLADDPQWLASFHWKLGTTDIKNVDELKPYELLVNSIPRAAISLFASCAYFKGTSENLALPSYSDGVQPSLSPAGYGLASLFSYLLGNNRKVAEQIEDSLKAIVPTIKQVGFKPAKITKHETRLIKFDDTVTPISDARQVIGQELVFDTTSADQVPASEMSEGTLLALGLLTLLRIPTNPKLIMLDDIEAGLHPLAQRQMMQILKDFAEKYARQIIVTSHSPYIIDELDAKDVWVMATDKEGVTHTKRLSDHPDAEKVLSVLTTGEFASAYDEEWVLGESQPAELVHG